MRRLTPLLTITAIIVSIHAPTWGATPPPVALKRVAGVSIHAPTWGATLVIDPYNRLEDVSIHAPTWGATSHQDTGAWLCGFQSTHPHGVRRTSTGSWGWPPCFNPRTHMGCDGVESIGQRRVGVSIHAPTWGATSSERELQPNRLVSIHAPTWGATVMVGAGFGLQIHCFNPRTHMGCDANNGL